MRSLRYSGRLEGWGVCLPRGVCVCVPGGCLPGEGVCVCVCVCVCLGGVCREVSVQGDCEHLPCVDRMKDACENITFPQLLWRTVKRLV